jgi:hypothetical protein
MNQLNQGGQTMFGKDGLAAYGAAGAGETYSMASEPGFVPAADSMRAGAVAPINSQAVASTPNATLPNTSYDGLANTGGDQSWWQSTGAGDTAGFMDKSGAWHQGTKGWGDTAITAGLGLGNLYMGYQQYGLAKDQFNEQMRMNNENLGMAKDQLYGKNASGQYNTTTKRDQSNAAYAAAGAPVKSAFAG